jgi:hypothetical protein
MNLSMVSIAGADDATDPREMASLCDEYPQLRWGLVLYRPHEGKPRYPTFDWLMGLNKYPSLKQRIVWHLCGQYVADLLEGNFSFYKNRKELLALSQQVQLNFKGVEQKPTASFIPTLKYFSVNHFEPYRHSPPTGSFQGDNPQVRSWIIQCFKPEWAQTFYDCLYDGVICLPLIDTSGGGGVVPEAWPAPLEPSYTITGYAGGLSPDNLEEQLKLIGKQVNNFSCFIDVESGVRTNDRLDMKKVRKFLQIASHYFEKDTRPNGQN